MVATAVGGLKTKRVEWDRYDLTIGDGIGVEVKSAAYVQAWKQAQPSVISFDIGPRTGWDADTDTHAAGPGRSAAVYVFCLLEGEDREHIDPLDVEQWTFYVLSTSVLNREVAEQRTIRLGPLKALGAHPCTYDELKAAIDAAATPGHLHRQPGDRPALNEVRPPKRPQRGFTITRDGMIVGPQ